MESQKVKKMKKKVAGGRKNCSTFLLYAPNRSRWPDRSGTGHRSRSSDECASLLEEDDDDGDEAAEDSAPAATAPPC